MSTPSDAGQNPPESPQLRVLSQYVKELSFRNALGASTQGHEQQPLIDMGVEVKSRPIGERGEGAEVDLWLSAQALSGDDPLFSVELVY